MKSNLPLYTESYKEEEYPIYLSAYMRYIMTLAFQDNSESLPYF